MVYRSYQSIPATALYKSLIGDSSIQFLVAMVLDLYDIGSVEEYRITLSSAFTLTFFVSDIKGLTVYLCVVMLLTCPYSPCTQTL